jgi:myo-inositol-1(or 4)-monophosphatase
MNFAEHADCARAVALATRLADTARAIARRHFRQPLAVEQKADRSPVTAADREIETELRRMIRAEFPTHGIRGEEFAAEAGAEFTWVLDPIDGTKSFISGFPLFGTLIALVHAEQPVLGVIEAPATGERWLGGAGMATAFNGTRVRTSDCADIDRARVYSTTADTIRGEHWQRYDRYTQRAVMRRFGGDCYLYGMLASGYCDLVIEAALKPHDFMALVPIVQGAGGRISDWNGAALDWDSGDRVVAAATPALWEQAIAALAAR